jgi:hypothetical protein
MGGADRIVIGCQHLERSNKYLNLLRSRLSSFDIKIDPIEISREKIVNDIFLMKD